jgi:hypothetical protein
MKMEFPIDIATLRLIGASHSLRIIPARPCSQSVYGWKIVSFDILYD